MPTTTIGLFFVGRDAGAQKACSTHVDDDKEFVLKLRVVDNQGSRRVEPYVVRWKGSDAQAWWNAHGPLKAGDALSLELLNPRSFPGLRAPEIHADIARCRLMPARAHGTAASTQGA